MKKIIKYFLDYNFLMILLILFFSNETMMFGTNNNNSFIIIQYIALIAILFICMFRLIKRRKISTKGFLFLVTLVILVLLSAVLKDKNIFENNNFFKYFYEILLFIIAFCYVSQNSINVFFIKYLKTIVFLATVSWIPFLLNIFVPKFISRMPIITNISNVRFYNMIIGVAPVNELYSSIYRNYSIFREPGIFSLFLLLAMIILLFAVENKKYFMLKFLLLTFTIISTLSTAGVISLIILLGVYFISNKLSFKRVTLVLVLLISIIGIMNYSDIPFKIFGKFTSSNQSSVISRTNSIKSNLFIFFDGNILLGTGWGYNIVKFNDTSKSLIYQNTYKENTYHNTNTLLRILSTHGIIVFFIVAKGLYGFFKQFTINKKKDLFIFMLFSIALFNENISLNLLLYIMIFYGLIFLKKVGDNYENN